MNIKKVFLIFTGLLVFLLSYCKEGEKLKFEIIALGENGAKADDWWNQAVGGSDPSNCITFEIKDENDNYIPIVIDGKEYNGIIASSKNFSEWKDGKLRIRSEKIKPESSYNVIIKGYGSSGELKSLGYSPKVKLDSGKISITLNRLDDFYPAAIEEYEGLERAFHEIVALDKTHYLILGGIYTSKSIEISQKTSTPSGKTVSIKESILYFKPASSVWVYDSVNSTFNQVKIESQLLSGNNFNRVLFKVIPLKNQSTQNRYTFLVIGGITTNSPEDYIMGIGLHAPETAENLYKWFVEEDKGKEIKDENTINLNEMFRIPFIPSDNAKAASVWLLSYDIKENRLIVNDYSSHLSGALSTYLEGLSMPGFYYDNQNGGIIAGGYKFEKGEEGLKIQVQNKFLFITKEGEIEDSLRNLNLPRLSPSIVPIPDGFLVYGGYLYTDDIDEDGVPDAIDKCLKRDNSCPSTQNEYDYDGDNQSSSDYKCEKINEENSILTVNDKCPQFPGSNKCSMEYKINNKKINITDYQSLETNGLIPPAGDTLAGEVVIKNINTSYLLKRVTTISPQVYSIERDWSIFETILPLDQFRFILLGGFRVISGKLIYITANYSCMHDHIGHIGKGGILIPCMTPDPQLHECKGFENIFYNHEFTFPPSLLTLNLTQEVTYSKVAVEYNIISDRVFNSSVQFNGDNLIIENDPMKKYFLISGGIYTTRTEDKRRNWLLDTIKENLVIEASCEEVDNNSCKKWSSNFTVSELKTSSNNLVLKRWGHTSTLLHDGSVLIFGGFTFEKNSLKLVTKGSVGIRTAINPIYKKDNIMVDVPQDGGEIKKEPHCKAEPNEWDLEKFRKERLDGIDGGVQDIRIDREGGEILDVKSIDSID